MAKAILRLPMMPAKPKKKQVYVLWQPSQKQILRALCMASKKKEKRTTALTAASGAPSWKSIEILWQLVVPVLLLPVCFVFFL